MSTSAIVDRVRTLLDTTPPFDRLAEDVRKGVLADVSLQYFNAGDVILQQGTTTHPGLYIVESGLVRLMDVATNRLIEKVGEGETFGSFGLIKGGGSIYEAKAIEPTVCALLKGSRFQQLYDQEEDFEAYYDTDLREYVRRLGTELDVTGAHLLFSRNLEHLVHRALVTCEPSLPAREAAVLMQTEGVDSLLVEGDGRLLGMLTDIDLRNRLVARDRPAGTPVGELMSSPIITIANDASIFEAVMKMLTSGVHRLVITREAEGQVVPLGILTDRDVAHFRGLDPVATVARIEGASTVDELVSIRARTNELLLNLHRQGTPSEMLYAIMTVFYDSIAVRVLHLVERQLKARYGEEAVDLPWVWIRLGSGGRQEMVLNSQQHNALCYADPHDEDEARRAAAWFTRIAGAANEALEACGFRPSQYVARDPRCWRSLHGWKQVYREWILQADEDSLVPTPIFFDLRGVYGDVTLVEDVKSDVVDALNIQEMDENRTFLRMMASNAVDKGPSASLVRKVLERLGERQGFDVRESGVVPIVDAARVLALEARVLATTNTFDRLRQAAARLDASLTRPIEDALDAYKFIVDFRLESQLRAFETGDEPSNMIHAGTLTKMQHRLLREAFQKASRLQDAMAGHYALSRRWLS